MEQSPDSRLMTIIPGAVIPHRPFLPCPWEAVKGWSFPVPQRPPCDHEGCQLVPVEASEFLAVFRYCYQTCVRRAYINGKHVHLQGVQPYGLEHLPLHKVR